MMRATPTQDTHQAKADLFELGYCIVNQALTDEQVRAMRQRVDEEAKTEVARGLACEMGEALRSPGPKTSVAPTQTTRPRPVISW